MKPFVIALVAAVLVAAQILSPVAAATQPSAAAAPLAATCGDTYTVKKGDYLYKIALYCGVTLTNLINANPEIKNTNIIYPGQVIRIKNDSTIPVTGGTSNYTVRSGDTLFLISVRFGTTVDALLKLNPSISDRNKIFVGQVIKIPGSGGGTIPVTGARVTLSTLYPKASGSVTVTVAGFPKSASIDYRVGKQGADYSVAIDGTTNSTGGTSATVKIPSTAKAGEKWVVTVMTTELAVGTTVTSSVMTIQ